MNLKSKNEINFLTMNNKSLKKQGIKELIFFNLRNAFVFLTLIVLSQAPTFVMLFMLEAQKKYQLSQYITVIFSMLVFAMILGIAYLFTKKINVINKEKLFTKKNLAYIIIGYLVMQLTSNLFIYLSGDKVAPINIEILSAAPGILLFTIAGILTPIFEEIVFRGFLMGYWFKEYPSIGYILNILIFTMIHGPNNIYSILLYMTTAIIFGTVYSKTKNLKITIIIHILNNLPGAITLARF